MPRLPLRTPWQQHVEDWKSCTLCELSKSRSRVVLARGSIPCDLLFVGEAPGESENAVGKPFVGPAGRLLDLIIIRSIPHTRYKNEDDPGKDQLVPEYSYALTNIVSCIPREEDGSKTSEPPDEAVKACQPRLKEIVQIADPKLLVCVGKFATDWLTPGFRHSIKLHRPVSMIHIVHPAAILRANQAQQGLMIQRCVVQISKAVEKITAQQEE